MCHKHSYNHKHKKHLYQELITGPEPCFCQTHCRRQKLCTAQKIYAGRKNQQGSMLVISIFIIIVISVLAASLSKILSSSADSVATEVYSSKAYYAAESGMESAIYRVLRTTLKCEAFPSKKDLGFDVAGIKELENCEVKMTCQEIVIDADNSQFYLTSNAVCGTDNMRSQHRIEAEIK